MDVNEYQIGGDHYKAKEGEMQHWDRVSLFGMPYLLGCATKYVERWPDKNGLEDLRKASHYFSKLLDTPSVLKAYNRRLWFRLIADRYLPFYRDDVKHEWFAIVEKLRSRGRVNDSYVLLHSVNYPLNEEALTSIQGCISHTIKMAEEGKLEYFGADHGGPDEHYVCQDPEVHAARRAQWGGE